MIEDNSNDKEIIDMAQKDLKSWNWRFRGISFLR